MVYRLSDASNARSLVTSVPNVNQLRNVYTAVKIIFLRTAPNKIQESKCANCNLKHPANYIQCDVYIKQLQTVIQSRGLDQSTPHNG